MRRITLCTVVALIALTARPAFAQEEPPARVGRVSFVAGQLAFHGATETQWSAAAVNYPVATGGSFWADPQSRAELRIGSRTIVFTEGEVIHTENSHKYRLESFEALVERGGWRVKTVWTSDAPSFGVFLLDTEGAEVVVERQSPVKIESS